MILTLLERDWLEGVSKFEFKSIAIIFRHYFANRGPSSQGYGFSSGHV